jgi:hypothetical protein
MRFCKLSTKIIYVLHKDLLQVIGRFNLIKNKNSNNNNNSNNKKQQPPPLPDLIPNPLHVLGKEKHERFDGLDSSMCVR